MRHIVSLWNGCNPVTQNRGKMKHERVVETETIKEELIRGLIFKMFSSRSRDNRLEKIFLVCEQTERIDRVD